MGGYWLCDTPHGTFHIRRTCLGPEDRYMVLFDDDLLGTCGSVEQGLRLLTEEHAFKAACGLDIARMSIPRSLSGWTFAPTAHPVKGGAQEHLGTDGAPGAPPRRASGYKTRTGTDPSLSRVLALDQGRRPLSGPR